MYNDAPLFLRFYRRLLPLAHLPLAGTACGNITPQRHVQRLPLQPAAKQLRAPVRRVVCIKRLTSLCCRRNIETRYTAYGNGYNGVPGRYSRMYNFMTYDTLAALPAAWHWAHLQRTSLKNIMAFGALHASARGGAHRTRALFAPAPSTSTFGETH